MPSLTPMNAPLVGQLAPDFTTKTHTGETIQLSQFRGQKVALYFYPEDDSPLCTDQACNLRDHYGELLAHGIVVLGVSPDPMAPKKAFAEKFTLPFPLLPDPDKQIMGLYGTWGEKNMYGKIVLGTHRWTYLIGEDGVIQHVIKKPKIKAFTADILKKFGF